MTIAILNTEILRMLLVEHTMKAKCNKGLFIFIHNFRKKGTDIIHGYGIYVKEDGSKYEG